MGDAVEGQFAVGMLHPCVDSDVRCDLVFQSKKPVLAKRDVLARESLSLELLTLLDIVPEWHFCLLQVGDFLHGNRSFGFGLP